MQTKAGFVTIIGKPNVGKSTLMNALIGEKLSIITSKPQTTRKRILGILSEEEFQIVFFDTPGILQPDYPLQEKMMDFVIRSVNDADIIIFIIDINNDPTGNKTFNDKAVKQILSLKTTVKFLIINKVDISSEEEVKRLISKIEEQNLFDKIIPISALMNFNLNNVKDSILEFLPGHPKYYPDDQLTDASARFFVSEIIREKIFELYREELPYSIEVVIEDFREREKRKDYISAFIIVEKESQKPIIIGKGGEAIKKLGKISREEIESFLQREVYLELRVKVKGKWRSSQQQLKNFGYSISNE